MKSKGLIAAAVAFCLGAGSLRAGLVDAVSIVVDDQPITLYEIYKTRQETGLSKKKAVEHLIKQKLKEEELKRLGIRVDDFDVTNEIEKIAKSNGIDSLKMRAIMAKRGIDWEAYRQKIKKKLQQERLYQRILSTKIQPPAEEALREYYRLHLNEFSVPEAVDVIQYSASDAGTLEKVMVNPLASVPGVTQEAKRLPASKLNRQLLYLLTQTPRGEFTQIIPVGGQSVVFYVKGYVNPRPIPYDQVKNQVYARWMEEKRKEAIKSHFEKLRAAADVRVLRAP